MTLRTHRLCLWFIIFVSAIDLTQVSKLHINIVLSFSDIDWISPNKCDVKRKFGLKWTEISIFVFLPFRSSASALQKNCYFNMSKSYFIILIHYFTIHHTSFFFFSLQYIKIIYKNIKKTNKIKNPWHQLIATTTHNRPHHYPPLLQTRG